MLRNLLCALARHPYGRAMLDAATVDTLPSLDTWDADTPPVATLPALPGPAFAALLRMLDPLSLIHSLRSAPPLYAWLPPPLVSASGVGMVLSFVQDAVARLPSVLVATREPGARRVEGTPPLMDAFLSPAAADARALIAALASVTLHTPAALVDTLLAEAAHHADLPPAEDAARPRGAPRTDVLAHAPRGRTFAALLKAILHLLVADGAAAALAGSGWDDATSPRSTVSGATAGPAPVSAPPVRPAHAPLTAEETTLLQGRLLASALLAVLVRSFADGSEAPSEPVPRLHKRALVDALLAPAMLPDVLAALDVLVPWAVGTRCTIDVPLEPPQPAAGRRESVTDAGSVAPGPPDDGHHPRARLASSALSAVGEGSVAAGAAAEGRHTDTRWAPWQSAAVPFLAYTLWGLTVAYHHADDTAPPPARHMPATHAYTLVSLAFSLLQVPDPRVTRCALGTLTALLTHPVPRLLLMHLPQPQPAAAVVVSPYAALAAKAKPPAAPKAVKPPPLALFIRLLDVARSALLHYMPATEAAAADDGASCSGASSSSASSSAADASGGGGAQGATLAAALLPAHPPPTSSAAEVGVLDALAQLLLGVVRAAAPTDSVSFVPPPVQPSTPAVPQDRHAAAGGGAGGGASGTTATVLNSLVLVTRSQLWECSDVPRLAATIVWLLGYPAAVPTAAPARRPHSLVATPARLSAARAIAAMLTVFSECLPAAPHGAPRATPADVEAAAGNPAAVLSLGDPAASLLAVRLLAVPDCFVATHTVAAMWRFAAVRENQDALLWAGALPALLRWSSALCREHVRAATAASQAAGMSRYSAGATALARATQVVEGGTPVVAVTARGAESTAAGGRAVQLPVNAGDGLLGDPAADVATALADFGAACAAYSASAPLPPPLDAATAARLPRVLPLVSDRRSGGGSEPAAGRTGTGSGSMTASVGTLSLTHLLMADMAASRAVSPATLHEYVMGTLWLLAYHDSAASALATGAAAAVDVERTAAMVARRRRGVDPLPLLPPALRAAAQAAPPALARPSTSGTMSPAPLSPLPLPRAVGAAAPRVGTTAAGPVSLTLTGAATMVRPSASRDGGRRGRSSSMADAAAEAAAAPAAGGGDAAGGALVMAGDELHVSPATLPSRSAELEAVPATTALATPAVDGSRALAYGVGLAHLRDVVLLAVHLAAAMDTIAVDRVALPSSPGYRSTGAGAAASSSASTLRLPPAPFELSHVTTMAAWALWAALDADERVAAGFKARAPTVPDATRLELLATDPAAAVAVRTHVPYALFQLAACSAAAMADTACLAGLRVLHVLHSGAAAPVTFPLAPLVPTLDADKRAPARPGITPLRPVAVAPTSGGGGGGGDSGSGGAASEVVGDHVVAELEGEFGACAYEQLLLGYIENGPGEGDANFLEHGAALLAMAACRASRPRLGVPALEAVPRLTLALQRATKPAHVANLLYALLSMSTLPACQVSLATHSAVVLIELARLHVGGARRAGGAGGTVPPPLALPADASEEALAAIALTAAKVYRNIARNTANRNTLYKAELAAHASAFQRDVVNMVTGLGVVLPPVSAAAAAAAAAAEAEAEAEAARSGDSSGEEGGRGGRGGSRRRPRPVTAASSRSTVADLHATLASALTASGPSRGSLHHAPSGEKFAALGGGSGGLRAPGLTHTASAASVLSGVSRPLSGVSRPKTAVSGAHEAATRLTAERAMFLATLNDTHRASAVMSDAVALARHSTTPSGVVVRGKPLAVSSSGALVAPSGGLAPASPTASGTGRRPPTASTTRAAASEYERSRASLAVAPLVGDGDGGSSLPTLPAVTPLRRPKSAVSRRTDGGRVGPTASTALMAAAVDTASTLPPQSLAAAATSLQARMTVPLMEALHKVRSLAEHEHDTFLPPFYDDAVGAQLPAAAGGAARPGSPPGFVGVPALRPLSRGAVPGPRGAPSTTTPDRWLPDVVGTTLPPDSRVVAARSRGVGAGDGGGGGGGGGGSGGGGGGGGGSREGGGRRQSLAGAAAGAAGPGGGAAAGGASGGGAATGPSGGTGGAAGSGSNPLGLSYTPGKLRIMPGVSLDGKGRVPPTSTVLRTPRGTVLVLDDGAAGQRDSDGVLRPPAAGPSGGAAPAGGPPPPLPPVWRPLVGLVVTAAAHGGGHRRQALVARLAVRLTAHEQVRVALHAAAAVLVVESGMQVHRRRQRRRAPRLLQLLPPCTGVTRRL